MRTSNHAFIRRQFYIARDHSEFLREIAYKRHMSQARIVRDAIRMWAKFHNKTELSKEPETMA